MGKQVSWGFVSNTAAALLAAILGAVMIKYGDLPTRMSVIESDHANLKDTVKSMDGKLDTLLTIVSRRR